jgi:hypothetical protein
LKDSNDRKILAYSGEGSDDPEQKNINFKCKIVGIRKKITNLLKDVILP